MVRSGKVMKFYDCSICGLLHPWNFNGDCRNDDKRFTFDEIPEDSKIHTMEERIKSDLKEVK